MCARRERSRRWGWLLRLAGCLLLVVIVFDLAADARCDVATPAGQQQSTLCASGGADACEACVSFCVPDCFCCSRSVGAVAGVAPPRPGLATTSTPAVRQRWPLGVRPVVDHPPLLRG